MRISRLRGLLPLAALSVAPAGAAALSAYPDAVQLTGRNATQVVTVSAGERDVTSECTFEVSNAAVAQVTKDAMVTAAGDGKSSLTIRWKSERVVVPVTVSSAREEPKLSFVKDVVPIFTMAGCAGSNCHGSIRGQHGFKLSLFGYEPDLDYQAIQSRINKEQPEQSLLLRKPTSQVSHGGGLRFTPASLEYRSILEWIKGGATYDSAGSPRIASLTIFPRERTLEGPGATQQLVATARYTDGTTRDVTHWSSTPPTIPTLCRSRLTAKSKPSKPEKPPSWSGPSDRRSPPKSTYRARRSRKPSPRFRTTAISMTWSSPSSSV